MYHTRTIITRSWFETPLNYKPRILRLRKVSCNTNRSIKVVRTIFYNKKVFCCNLDSFLIKVWWKKNNYEILTALYYKPLYNINHSESKGKNRGLEWRAWGRWMWKMTSCLNRKSTVLSKATSNDQKSNFPKTMLTKALCKFCYLISL